MSSFIIFSAGWSLFSIFIIKYSNFSAQMLNGHGVVHQLNKRNQPTREGGEEEEDCEGSKSCASSIYRVSQDVVYFFHGDYSHRFITQPVDGLGAIFSYYSLFFFSFLYGFLAVLSINKYINRPTDRASGYGKCLRHNWDRGTQISQVTIHRSIHVI